MREKQESLGLKVAAFLVSIAVLSSELIAETRQTELGHPCGASIIFTYPAMHCVPQHFASTLFQFLLVITVAPYIFFLYFSWGGGGGGTGYIMGDEKMWNRELTYLKPIAVKRRRRHVYELPISSELYLIWLKLSFYQRRHSARVYQFFGHLKNCVHFNLRWRLLLLYQLMLLKCARVCMRAKHKKKLLMLKPRGTR